MHTTTRNPIQNCHRTKAFNVRYKSFTAPELSHWLQLMSLSCSSFNLQHFNQVAFLRGHSCPSPSRSPKGFEGTRPLTPAFSDSHPLQPGTSSFTHLAEPRWLESHCCNKDLRIQLKVRGQRSTRRKGPRHAPQNINKTPDKSNKSYWQRQWQTPWHYSGTRYCIQHLPNSLQPHVPRNR